MISFEFLLSNPWSSRWDNLVSKNGRISENKAWELNVYKTNTLVCISGAFRIRTDHAGARLHCGLLGYEVEFNFYDTRHWDDNTNNWVRYD